MATFLIYIIKSGICLTLFYLGYKILFSRETFFRFNRWVLLSGIVICHLLPFIQLNIESPGIIQQSFITLEKAMTEENIVSKVETILYEEVSLQENQTNTIPSGFIPVIIYTSGILITFLGLFFSFVSLFLLIHSGRRIESGEYVIVITEQPIAPFNWWKYIVLNRNDYSPFPNEILLHELAHLHKNHSWDLLFTEFIILFHWFHPSSWLLKRELQEIHEFEADREVLNSGIDATKYQLLLVKKAVGSRSYTFANSFNQSKLKKRITMMCKVKSNKWARWKLLLLLPVAIGILYAFARPEMNRQLKQLLPDEDTTKLQEDQLYDVGLFESKITNVDQSIIVNFYEEDNFIQNVVIQTHDTDEVIFEKIKTIPMEKVHYVLFQAPPKTYMGFITDIKNIIRELNPKLYWKVEYSIL